MLFGNNPWVRRFGQPQPQPPAPVAQPPQYAAPTWPGQTPDGTYANGLAGYYAAQLQNQMVPGTVMPPVQQPIQPPPAQVPETGQPGTQQPFQNGWRDAFKSALMDWRGQRPDDRSGFADWRAARPVRQDYRQGGSF